MKSTDEGVAFIVREKDGTIYHAGDLNWWHWEGEPKSRTEIWKLILKEIDSMKGRKIDIACNRLIQDRKKPIIWEWTIL